VQEDARSSGLRSGAGPPASPPSLLRGNLPSSSPLRLPPAEWVRRLHSGQLRLHLLPWWWGRPYRLPVLPRATTGAAASDTAPDAPADSVAGLQL
jgi:hypothetical protein